MDSSFKKYLVLLIMVSGLFIVLFVFVSKRNENRKKEAKNSALASYYTGSVCYKAKIWDRAVESFRKANEYAFQAEDSITIAKSYHSLGLIFYNNNLLDSAVINYNKALTYYSKLQNTDVYKMRVLIYIGSIYMIMNEYDRAEGYFRQSFEIACLIGNMEYQGYGYHNLGVIDLNRREYSNALVCFQKAMPEIGNAEESIKIYLNMSRLYTETNELDSATYYISMAKQHLLQIKDDWSLAYTYRVLKDYYKEMQNDKDALYYSALNDSVRQIINNHDLAKQLYESRLEVATVKNL